MISAVVVAAGASSRMKLDKSKLLLEVSGKTVIKRTLEVMEKTNIIEEIVLVVRDCDKVEITKECENIKKLTAIVVGGDNRQDSVLNGISATKGEFVAVHDGARPLVTTEEIEKVCKDALKYNFATLSTIPKDTIKIARKDNFVLNTPNRDDLRIITTPQVFKKDLYMEAIKKAKKENKIFTDDCQLIENNNGDVYLTLGEYTNIKITTREDIPLAENIIKLQTGEN